MRVLLWSLCILLISCNGDILFQKKSLVSGPYWNYDSPMVFTFDIMDTSYQYDISLNINHARDFGFQNLYTGMHTVFPGGDTIFQRFSTDISNNMGQWLGTCKGNECTYNVLVRKGTSFPEEGTYQLILHQFSRVDSLKGINFIELTIATVEH